MGVFIWTGAILGGLAVWAVLALAESKRVANGKHREPQIFRRSSRMILWFVVALGLATLGTVFQQPYVLFTAAVAHIAGAIWTGFAPREDKPG